MQRRGGSGGNRTTRHPWRAHAFGAANAPDERRSRDGNAIRARRRRYSRRAGVAGAGDPRGGAAGRDGPRRPPPSGSSAVSPVSACLPACSVVSPSGVASWPTPGEPLLPAPRPSPTLLRIELSTRNVTKPATSRSTTIAGDHIAHAVRLPASPRARKRFEAGAAAVCPACAMNRPAAIIDVDGTLVDTNYQHALAWFRAFRQHGITLPLWEIHRHIGMGGDQLVPSWSGEGFDERARRRRPRRREGALPVADARGRSRWTARATCSSACARAGTRSSSPPRPSPTSSSTTSTLLDARQLVDGWTTSGDVERTKPEPDLVAAAVEKAGGGDAVMIGDSTWDCEAAAKRAGIETIGVLTGGFSEAELRDAGAACVFRSLPELARGPGRPARWR